MALPVLDSVFASASDLPRRQMLAKWLVEETETGGNSSVAVLGLSETSLNGTYVYDIDINGKPSYLKGLSFISWNGASWILNDGDNNATSSDSDVEFPWLATDWYDEGVDPDGLIITEIPPQSPTIADYYDLPERYLWAKIAVAAGAPRGEVDYISLPKNYAWSDIYNAVASASGSNIDWTEKQALGHIAAAYRGDTQNPESLATYISWPWRYQVASIITSL